MIRYHIALFLTLNMVAIRAADPQKIKIILSSCIEGANVERKAPDIVDEIDLTQKETCTRETFGNLRAKAEARGTPWPITAVLVRANKECIIDYLDVVELVRAYGSYTKDDFRSLDKAMEVLDKANKKFLENFYPEDSVETHVKVLYTNRRTVGNPCSVDYNFSYKTNRLHHVKVMDIHAILAIALCGDYTPALALAGGLQEDTENLSRGKKKFWINFIAQLPEDTLKKAQEQFLEAYPE